MKDTTEKKKTTQTKKTTRTSSGTSSSSAENKQSKAETSTEDKTASQSGNEQQEQDFWDEARENVSTGAKIVGETVSEYTERFLENLKSTATKAYKASSEFTMETVHKAQEVIDNYRDQQSIRRLSEERTELAADLGMLLYRSMKSNDDKLPDSFDSQQEVNTLLKKIGAIDQHIVEISHHDLEK